MKRLDELDARLQAIRAKPFGGDEHAVEILIGDLAALIAIARAAADMITSDESGRLSRRDSMFHAHEIPGVWDLDNTPDIAGKPCAMCAAWSSLITALDRLETE